MQAVEALEILELLGSTQWGLVTSAQAKAANVERLWLSRLAGKGILQRIRYGVYALPSAAVDPHQDVHAAWLATVPTLTAAQRRDADDPVVVGGVSAAAIHQVGDLIPVKHEFISPTRRQSSQADVVFRREEIPPRDITWADGLPVTSVPRTVVDLAKAPTDAGHLADIVSQALSERAVNHENLAGRLDPYAKQYGHQDGHELLQDLMEQSPPRRPMIDFAVPNRTVGELIDQRPAESLHLALQRLWEHQWDTGLSGRIQEEVRKYLSSVSSDRGPVDRSD